MNTNNVLFILSLSLLLCCTGCSVNPVTGNRQLMLISQNEEIQIGKEYAPEVERQLGGRINNPDIQNYVNRVGQKIAKISHRSNLKYSFVAVNSDITNAVALPGGYVFITRGMLETLETEDQLAAVLAHETAHITARHSANLISKQIGFSLLLSVLTNENTSDTAIQYANLGAQLIGLKYSRDFERQADSVGTDYLVKAGYSPYAMVDLMQKLEQLNSVRPIEFFSTHPSPENRTKLINQQIRDRRYPKIPRSNPQIYKQTISSKL